MATFEKKKKLPAKFQKKLPMEVTDLETLVRERDGPPLRPNQYNDPYHHNWLIGEVEVESPLTEEGRLHRYKWVARVFTTFTSIEMLEYFGSVWTHMGSFNFNGQYAWAAKRVEHFAQMMGSEVLAELAAKVLTMKDKL